MTKEELEKIEIAPIVLELTGVIQLDQSDYRIGYLEHLVKKYS